jgi:molecular chaperone DnaK (HSP70)
LPITRSERFYTSHSYQEEVHICVYEGEDEDALRDILVGDFEVKGLAPVREENEVLCRMSLDLDGILHVTAIEKRSGLSKHITIARALETKSEAEIAAARKRLELLYLTGQGVQEEEDAEEEVGEGSEEVFDEDLVEALSAPLESSAEKDDWSVVAREGKQLIERSRQSLGQLHEDDREEAIDLNAQIESAIDANDVIALKQAAQELRELLFFVEGRSA